MIDLVWLCSFAIRAVYWLVLMACNFLGYSNIWAKRALKKREHEEDLKFLKIPHHLAVVYSDRKIYLSDIVGFLECCSMMGIRRVTLYDPWGDILALENKLRMFSHSKNFHLLVRSTPSFVSPTSRMTVQLLDGTSGKDTLVEACKLLSSSTYTITVDDVTKVLNKKFNLVDPELLLQVGQTPSLVGYPPWNLRITEFVQLRSLPSCRYSLEDSISQFSKRDIRIGK